MIYIYTVYILSIASQTQTHTGPIRAALPIRQCMQIDSPTDRLLFLLLPTWSGKECADMKILEKEHQ